MNKQYYKDLIDRLKDAAGWVYHQQEEAPDWDALLLESAEAIQTILPWLPLDDGGPPWISSSYGQAIEQPSGPAEANGISDLKSD